MPTGRGWTTAAPSICSCRSDGIQCRQPLCEHPRRSQRAAESAGGEHRRRSRRGLALRPLVPAGKLTEHRKVSTTAAGAARASAWQSPTKCTSAAGVLARPDSGTCQRGYPDPGTATAMAKHALQNPTVLTLLKSSRAQSQRKAFS